MNGEEEVRRLLREAGVAPQKERGQNFLVDMAAVQTIIRFGRPEQGGRIVEIGPGLAALSAELAPYGPLSVIEIEHGFCRMLKQRLPQVEVIEADVRSVDFSRFGRDLTVFGNLPYSLSTDITLHLLEQAHAVRRAVLLLQREFAERLAAPPGGRSYGAITVACQLNADLRLGPVIGGDSFYPEAGVESQLIELRFLGAPRCSAGSAACFRRVVAAAFGKRRKKLSNSLRAAFPQPAVAQALAAAGIDPGRRAETLSVEDFCRLSSAFEAQNVVDR